MTAFINATAQDAAAFSAAPHCLILSTITPDNWRELDQTLANRITSFVFSALEEQSLLDVVAGWECFIQAPYPWMRTGATYSVWFTGPNETIIVDDVVLQDGWPISAGLIRREPYRCK